MIARTDRIMSEGESAPNDGAKGGQDFQRHRFPKVYFKPKPVKIGEERDVTIAEVSKRGDGVTRIDGYVIFVPNTKQGDTIKIRIDEIRPNFASGSVVTPSAAPQ